MPSPQLAEALEFMAQNAVPLDATVPERRAILEARARNLPMFPGAQAEAVQAPGVSGEWVSLAGVSGETVIFFIHGGGYVAGTAAGSRDLVARLCQATGARALSSDYPRAPEAPFPAAVEDCVAAYRWLLAQGVAPEHCAVAGPSAGGELVAATLLALRVAGLRLPACAVCMSPFVDMTVSAESLGHGAGRDVLDPGVVRSFARLYVQDADPRLPLASPVFADLNGLPPLLIQVGTAEILLDDARALAARARACGVAVTYEEWEDMFHGWQGLAALLPEGAEAIAHAGGFMRAHCL